MKSKVVIVTGANAGIGKATALKLATAGATVVMACRNLARAEDAKTDIITESGNERVEVIGLDTSSMASVRSFAKAVNEKHEAVDVLINNAGNFDLTVKAPVMTSEGFETIFATNYLGPWLLTTTLEAALQRAEAARVINIGSKGLMAYPFLDIEFDNFDGAKKFSAQRAYYLSKLAMVAFTKELARRYSGTTATANLIRVPAVQLDLDRLPEISSFLLGLYKFKRRFSLTPAEMAETYVWLALNAAASRLNGAIIDERQQEVSAPKRACDDEVNAKLWEETAKMLSAQ